MGNPQNNIGRGSVPIVASCDENFARHMGVMFVSLLENTASPERCQLFVIDGGINRATRKILEQEVEKRKGNISFLDLDQNVYKDYPLTRNMSPAAYYRISIPELFSEEVTKVIYLDCDTVVKDDIVKLWEFPLNGNHAAAVQNLSNSTYLASGLPQHKYFNSGVMLVDLALWRKDGIAEKVRQFKLAHPEKIQTNDQCALNGVLFDSWERLPLRWNQQYGIYRSSSKRFRSFTAEEVQEALWNPAIIHYISTGKPWKYPCFHPLAGEYYRYLNHTAWAGARPEGRSVKAFFAWSLRPKWVKRYLRQKRWHGKYAKLPITGYN